MQPSPAEWRGPSLWKTSTYALASGTFSRGAFAAWHRSIIRRMKFLRPALVTLMALLVASGLASCSTSDQPDAASTATTGTKAEVSGERVSGPTAGDKDRGHGNGHSHDHGHSHGQDHGHSHGQGQNDDRSSNSLALATEASSDALAVVDPAIRRSP